MQHRRALVVDDRAEDARLALDVAEPVAEVHRALIRFRDRPAPELPQHVDEDTIASRLLRVQRGEVLREAFTDPLLVIVLPADRLAPPLVRELVGEEELAG